MKYQNFPVEQKIIVLFYFKTNSFQKAIKEYGVPDIDVFQTVDLYEHKVIFYFAKQRIQETNFMISQDISAVTSCLFALGRACWKHPEFPGPQLGPKPADEAKRDFTEEQLNAGKTVIGLQAGQNKGATQAGQSMGAGRKIILGK